MTENTCFQTLPSGVDCRYKWLINRSNQNRQAIGSNDRYRTLDSS